MKQGMINLKKRFGPTKSFTFPEVLLTAAIVFISGTIMLASYIGIMQFLGVQQVSVELQQKARSAMAVIVRQLASGGGAVTINSAAGCPDCSSVTLPVPEIDSNTNKIKVSASDPPTVTFSANYAAAYAMANCAGTPKLQKTLPGTVITLDLADYVSSVQFISQCAVTQGQSCPPCTAVDLRSDEIRVIITMSKLNPYRRTDNPITYTLKSIVALESNNFTITTQSGQDEEDEEDSCLLAGTKIHLSDGSRKAIEEIKAGDLVLGYKNGDTLPVKVRRAFIHPKEAEYFVLETSGGQRAKITGNHPVFDGKKYVRVQSLKQGSPVFVLKDNKLVQASVKRLTRKKETVPVYNLEVTGTRNYFAEGILVHNKVTLEEPLSD